MSLYIQQEPPLSENIGSVDNSRRFFILGQKSWRARFKTCGIMLCDELQFPILNIVDPEFGYVRLVSRIFLNQDLATCGDSNIVHHLLAFRSIEQHLDRATGCWVGRGHKVDMP